MFCPVGINYGINTFDAGALSINSSINRILDLGVSSLRMFGTNPVVFDMLKGSNIELVVGAYPWSLTTQWASNPSAALTWLDANIMPWVNQVKIKAIFVANEVIDPGNSGAINYVVPGMWALYNALKTRGLSTSIKVQTPQHPGFVVNSYPPSAGYASADVAPAFSALLDFVSKTSSSLSLTIYPFYPWKDSTATLNKDFIFFHGCNGFYDKGSGLYYQNMFDAQIDSVLAAAAKLGYPNVDVQIAEAGWATAGSPVASVADATDFVQRQLGKLCSGQGTPMRPHKVIPFWIFEAFDEFWKGSPSAPWESYWGINYIDGTAKYSLELGFANQYPVPPSCAIFRYCRPKTGFDKNFVDEAVYWICSQGGVNCPAATLNCPSSASAAIIYNAYFQQQYQTAGSCYFSGSAVITAVSPIKSSQYPSCVVPGKPANAK